MTPLIQWLVIIGALLLGAMYFIYKTAIEQAITEVGTGFEGIGKL